MLNVPLWPATLSRFQLFAVGKESEKVVLFTIRLKPIGKASKSISPITISPLIDEHLVRLEKPEVVEIVIPLINLTANDDSRPLSPCSASNSPNLGR